jgi:PAS domain S-box-containing protein
MNAEDAFAIAADALPGLVWTARPDGTPSFFNRRWREYAGIDGADPSAVWRLLCHPDDLPGLLARWCDIVSSGRPGDIEARLRRRDGEYRWFRMSADPARDEQGRIVRWYGLCSDIQCRPAAAGPDLDAMIDTIPMTAWSTLPDGYCDFVNQRWLDYSGSTLQKAVGWGWAAVIHPDDLPALARQWQGCLASGEPMHGEARMRRFDGVYRWFLFLGNPLRDPAGNIVKWFGTNVDVEDRKGAEEALRESERNLIQIINTIPTTAWSTRPDGYCDFLSDRWLDYAGFTFEQAVGWNWSAAIHPDDADGLFGYWQGCLDSGTPVDTEARMRRFDGEYRWFLFRANPLRDAAGKIVKWFGTNVDIEDRKLAQEELRRSEVLLAEGQRVSQTGSFSWRMGSDEITASDELYRILGLPLAAPLTPGPVSDRVHPEDLAPLREKVSQARAGGLHIDHESRLRMQDGSYKNLRITASPSFDAEGVLEYVGAIQDVTERRRSEEALTEVRSELAYMTRVASMGVLTASIAHEVNQPLTGIITNCSACLHLLSARPPDVEAALETVRRSIRDSHRASDVIKRLRALFARQDTATEVVDINEATREVIALSMSELQRHRISLRAEFSATLPLVVGDRIQLQQVILNLLMNGAAALSAIDDRPRQLQVRTERSTDGGLLLSVQDNGVGIGDVDAERLFEAFYTTKSQGLGIGLSVSRTIVENHRGRLRANANDGPGATFTLSLPRVDGNGTLPPEGSPSPTAARRAHRPGGEGAGRDASPSRRY